MTPQVAAVPRGAVPLLLWVENIPGESAGRGQSPQTTVP